MSNTREIITLQFGNYANYVGTHWWNIQESQFNYDPALLSSNVNHDVLFREGRTLHGETTFTPRLLLVDLNGTIRHSSEEGELYRVKKPKTDGFEDLASTSNWDPERVELMKSEKVRKPTFQEDLDNPAVDVEAKEYDFAATVENWLDFSYSRYHPRTVNVVRDFEHLPDSYAFDTFCSGAEMWRSSFFEEDFGDKVRNYIEECDACQGFQVLQDCTDAFAGLGSECVAYLEEEYGKSVLVWPIISPLPVRFKDCEPAMNDTIRLMNIALNFSNLAKSSSLFVPLSTMERGWRTVEKSRKFPALDYKPTNYYQTSSILAAYLDTITLQYRLKDGGLDCSLPKLCSSMSSNGRKMAAGALGLPLGMNDTEDFIDFLDQTSGELLNLLSPNSEIGTDYIIQSVCLRGIPEQRLKRPREKAGKQSQMAAYRCSSVHEMFQLYLQCKNHGSMATVLSTDEPMKIKKPFPREILSEGLNSGGFIRTNNDEVARISSIPAIASVESSSKLFNTLDSLHRDVSRIKFKKINRFASSGMEEEEYNEAIEGLITLKEAYDDGWDL